MDIQLTEEQELFRASIQRLLRDQYDFDARRKIVATDEGWSRKHWKCLCRTRSVARRRSRKVPAVLAADRLATMIVMQEFGRNLVVEPFFETVVLAGGLIEDAGSQAQREVFLPQIMAGKSIWALAWAEGRSRYDFNNVATTARRQGESLCSERHQGRGDRRAMGGQADRLGADIGRAARSRRRQPLYGRSAIGQSSLAELQDDRWPARRRNHVDERASPGQPDCWERKARASPRWRRAATAPSPRSAPKPSVQ